LTSSYVCLFVMAGLDPAIHALLYGYKDVDARHKAGHDGGGVSLNLLAGGLCIAPIDLANGSHAIS